MFGRKKQNKTSMQWNGKGIKLKAEGSQEYLAKIWKKLLSGL